MTVDELIAHVNNPTFVKVLFLAFGLQIIGSICGSIYACYGRFFGLSVPIDEYPWMDTVMLVFTIIFYALHIVTMVVASIHVDMTLGQVVAVMALSVVLPFLIVLGNWLNTYHYYTSKSPVLPIPVWKRLKISRIAFLAWLAVSSFVILILLARHRHVLHEAALARAVTVQPAIEMTPLNQ